MQTFEYRIFITYYKKMSLNKSINSLKYTEKSVNKIKVG